jgi:hypothetical protein
MKRRRGRRTRRRWRGGRPGRRRRGGGYGNAPALYSPGGAEPVHRADPKDPDVFFSGGNNGSFLVYMVRRTGQSREVHPYPRMFSGEPSSALVERVQGRSPSSSRRSIPTCFHRDAARMEDDEQWTRLDTDQRRFDASRSEDDGPPGGPITGDMNGPEATTVFTLAPSKVDVNVI